MSGCMACDASKEVPEGSRREQLRGVYIAGLAVGRAMAHAVHEPPLCAEHTRLYQTAFQHVAAALKGVSV